MKTLSIEAIPNLVFFYFNTTFFKEYDFLSFFLNEKCLLLTIDLVGKWYMFIENINVYIIQWA